MKGILRLHSPFASRNGYFAQDDRVVQEKTDTFPDFY